MQTDETPAPVGEVTVLVVDDEDLTRDMLVTMVEMLGYKATGACNGAEAVALLELQPFDLVLVDLAMPEVDGFQVLDRIKSDLGLRHIPVIVISGMTKVENAIQCLQRGASDFLPKPINLELLRARVNSCLENKRLSDQQQGFLQRLQTEQERSERLLLNVLPATIAERLKQGETNIAEFFADATVLFASLVGFSKLSVELSPADLLQMINRIFSGFDHLAEEHGLEKIKTIGDSYMAAAGVPNWRADHAEAVADMALLMRDKMKTIHPELGRKIKMRIGINTGPVVAGVVGEKKFSYDLWGETVNVARWMEFMGRPGCIQVGAATYERLKDQYFFERSAIDAKGAGQMDSYLLMGRAK